MAATTFAGQNIGARKPDRVRKGMYISTVMGAGYSVLTGIMLLIFAPQVIGVFTTNQKVVEYGVYIMRYFCPFTGCLEFCMCWEERYEEQARRCRQWSYFWYLCVDSV